MSSARSLRIVTILATIQFLSMAGQNAISATEDSFGDIDVATFMLHDHDHYFYLARGHGRSGCGTRHTFSPSTMSEPSGRTENRDISASSPLEGPQFPATNPGLGIGTIAHNLGPQRPLPPALEYKPISKALHRRSLPVGPQLPLRPRPRLYTGRKSKLAPRHDHMHYQPINNEGSRPHTRMGGL